MNAIHASDSASALQRTVLHKWHVENAGRMVPFGGWEMPVQYASGIAREHIATLEDLWEAPETIRERRRKARLAERLEALSRYRRAAIVVIQPPAPPARPTTTRLPDGMVLDSGRLRLPYLVNNANIVVGDVLMSSGLGGVFPSGYPVGRVTEVTLRPEQAFAEVLAEPASSLDRDREVLLLWDSSEAAPQASDGRASEPTPDASVAGLH